MPLQVTLASQKEIPIVANLMQLYLHEQCKFHSLCLNDEGRFDLPHLPSFFEGDDRRAYLIRVRGKVAGFVLVQKNESVDKSKYFTIPDIFVMESYRHFGIGEESARMVIDQFDGQWRIAVKSENAAALAFWQKVIYRFTGNQFIESTRPGYDGKVFEFVAPPPSLKPETNPGIMTRPIGARAKTKPV